jgi:hypothetical protein
MFWFQVFTIVLAVLFLSIPFYLVFKGKKFSSGILWTWIMVMIFYSIFIPLDFYRMRSEGYTWEETGDPMNRMIIVILFGWLPGIFVSGLAVLAQWVFKGKPIESENK